MTCKWWKSIRDKLGKASNQKMPPTHVLIWKITHTCSLAKMIRDEVFATFKRCDWWTDWMCRCSFRWIVANMQIKSTQMHKRAVSQRSENCWTERTRIYMHDAFFRVSSTFFMFGMVMLMCVAVRFHEFIFWRFIWLLNKCVGSKVSSFNLRSDALNSLLR